MNQSTYNLGDTVCKKSGGAWHGTVVGCTQQS